MLKFRYRAVFFFACASFFLSACATAPKQPQEKQATASASGANEPMGPPEPLGPSLPEPPVEVFGPEPVQLRPVILVLGPGYARGFAHAGVLKALQEAKIPIASIVATEMGALLGILYGMNETIHGFEWSLQQLKEDFFIRKRQFFPALFGGPLDGKRLEAFMQKTLNGKKLEESKIPLQILLQEEGGSEPYLVKSGDAAAIARGAVALPVLLSPALFENKKVISAVQTRPFPVSEARLTGSGPIVVVDVLGAMPVSVEANAEAQKIAQILAEAVKNGASDIENADLVIRPDLNSIGFQNFEKKTEIIFRGKSAVLAELPAIRHLVGLPEPLPGATP